MPEVLRIMRYHPRAAVGDGGMTGAIRRWSDALTEAGARVTIAYDEGEPPATGGLAEWVRIEHRTAGEFRWPVGTQAALRDVDLVVLHSGWTLQNLLVAAAARRRGVPYLLEPRGAYDPHIVRRHAILKRLWWLAGERTLVRDTTAIHVFFEEERAHLDAIGYRGPIVVAPNGAGTPDDIRWTGAGGYLLWLGRFDPEHKGLDLLIDAVAELPAAARPTIRLHGPDWRGGKERTVRRIARRGVGASVLVGPPVYGDEKRRLLVEASAFLYPSRWDACPNAVLEAVSIGVPTLCTPYPLGSHLARQGGVRLADASVNALADALVGLTDREQTASIGARGAAIVRSDFQWSAVAARWLEQVDSCLRARRLRGDGATIEGRSAFSPP